MKTRTYTSGILLPRTATLIAAAGLVCALVHAAPQNKEDKLWSSADRVVRRLGGEHYKIDVLRRELMSIKEVVHDIEMLELLPRRITRLSDSELARFDTRVEDIRKSIMHISKDLDKLSRQLTEDLSISREMIGTSPVAEMFSAIKQNNLSRISRLMEIKHRTDTTWRRIERLLYDGADAMGIDLPHTRTRQDDREFLRIIRSNLGLESEKFYEWLTHLKDKLTERADITALEEMQRIDLHRMRTLLENGKYNILIKRMPGILKRYENIVPVDELRQVYLRAKFITGSFAEVVAQASLIPEVSPVRKKADVLYIQSLYRLGHYADVWEWAQQYDFSSLSGRNRNLCLWLSMESGLRREKSEGLLELSTQSVHAAPYALHVMHTLARHFFANNDFETAISICREARRTRTTTSLDDRLKQRILLLLAQLYYEQEKYELALKHFFELLDYEAHFSDGLYGISRCYIALGKYNKANISLKKLINQAPQSPHAIDALVVLAKRYVKKAHYEWQKTEAATQQKQRIFNLLQKTRNRMHTLQDANAAQENLTKLKEIRNQLQTTMDSIGSLDTKSTDRIRSYFATAEQITGFVYRYYHSGEFQEAVFTHTREKILYTLDSLITEHTATETQNNENESRQDNRSHYTRQQVKHRVRQMRFLQTTIHIDRHRWEKQRIAHHKRKIRFTIDSLRSGKELASDTTVVARISQQIERRKRSLDSLIVYEETFSVQSRRDLIRECQNKLALDPPPEDEVYIGYHLGELYFQQEKNEYRQRYARYESRLMRYDSLMREYRAGANINRPEPPQPPRPDYSRSIRTFSRLVNKYPEHDHIFPVYYSLGWCYNELSRPDSALAYMEKLARYYPDSRYAPQAWMYIGETAFDNNRLAKAEDAYRRVIQYPTSRWFDEALYKLAWTHYRRSNPNMAISSFIALIDLGKRSFSGKAQLQNEAMKYIAISFSEADFSGQEGLQRATEFIKRLGNRRMGIQILEKLGQIFEEQGRYSLAANSYNKILQLYPYDRRRPHIEYRLVIAQTRDMSPEQTVERKVDYFSKFHRKGTWTSAKEDAHIVARADSLAQHMMYEAVTDLHQQALYERDTTLYSRAANYYRTYIEAYPDHPNANECHYNMAEILFSLGRYEQAAQEYIAVSNRYPDSKYKENAAWNAIVASQRLLSSSENKPD